MSLVAAIEEVSCPSCGEVYTPYREADGSGGYETASHNMAFERWPISADGKCCVMCAMASSTQKAFCRWIEQNDLYADLVSNALDAGCVSAIMAESLYLDMAAADSPLLDAWVEEYADRYSDEYTEWRMKQ